MNGYKNSDSLPINTRHRTDESDVDRPISTELRIHQQRIRQMHPINVTAAELAYEYDAHTYQYSPDEDDELRNLDIRQLKNSPEARDQQRMIQSCPAPSRIVDEFGVAMTSSQIDDDLRYDLNDAGQIDDPIQLVGVRDREIDLRLSPQRRDLGSPRRPKIVEYSDTNAGQNFHEQERKNYHDGDYMGAVSSMTSHENNSDMSPKNAEPILETDRFGFQVTLNNASSLSSRDLLLPVEVLRKRELKWVEMLDKWPSFMNKRYDKIRERCRKGIPPSFRGKAWCYLSGAFYHMNNERSRYVFEALDAHPGDPRWNEDIKKDLHRQFPEHELFSREGPYGKLGQEDLFRLLKAYTVLHPEEGYCQGQAPVAATLLMHMPLKDAFYTFVQVCHKYLPGYYSPGLEAIQMDGDILYELLRKKSHMSYKHLKKNNVDPVLYMVEWFMCIFCRTLPWATVLRVWDVFFCEGVKTLFKVAIVLFKYCLGTKEQIRQFPGMGEIVERLRHLPPQVLEEEFLMNHVFELKLDDEDLERIHYKTLKRRKELKNKKQKQVNAKTI